MRKKAIIIAIICIVIDQVTKILISSYLRPSESVVIIKHFFSLTRAINSGAAFSILEGYTLILLMASIGATVFLFKSMKSFKSTKLVMLSLGLLLGGIIGNFIDRIVYGYVRDFLKFNIFGYNYPVFNIADACIVIGVILLAFCIMRGDEENGNKSRKSR